MRIAVVDDNMIFGQRVKKSLQSTGGTEDKEIDVFANGTLLMKALENGKKYSIYFLDVEMPDMSGLELAERIRNTDSDQYIVFLTAYEKYALPGIKAGAFYYVLKEEISRELPKVLGKIKKEELKRKAVQKTIVGNSSKFKKISYYNILYISRRDKNAVFHCQGEHHIETYVERKTLSAVFAELPEREFAYINSGEIVNLRRIDRYENDAVTLEGDITLTCSRRLKKDFERKAFSFWREK